MSQSSGISKEEIRRKRAEREAIKQRVVRWGVVGMAAAALTGWLLLATG